MTKTQKHKVSLVAHTDSDLVWRLFWICCLSLLMCSCKSARPSHSPAELHPFSANDRQEVDATERTHRPPVAHPFRHLGGPRRSANLQPQQRAPEQASANYPVQQVAHEYPVQQVAREASVSHANCGPGCAHCAGNSRPPALPHSAYGAPCACCAPRQPWVAQNCLPQDEYLYDGGDRSGAVNVANDWSVHGIDQEDTVVHYDTRQGGLEIQPSNRVCIYSPRFASVRRIDGLVQNTKMTKIGDAQTTIGPVRHDDVQIANAVTRQLQPGRHDSTNTPLIFKERTEGKEANAFQQSGTTKRRLKAYEDFILVRRGIFDASEKVRLAARVNAAKIWSHNKGLQVVVEGNLIYEAASVSGTQSVSMYELPEGKSRLRVVKVADKKTAKSGDIVEFTIRFDNVGDQTIGNVTVIDNLTTRLTYVADSQECDVEAAFKTEANDGESLVLRWEITKPLKVGKGGVVRFKCRVR